MTRAAYLPSGMGAVVQPMEIGGIDDIQRAIGGHFDVVKREHDGIMAVGYVHDEGLIRDMEPNYLASALFSREIRGNVVIVNGYNESGYYDGGDYDLPTEFVLFLATTFTNKVAMAYNQATVIAMAMEFVEQNNLATEQELQELMEGIEAYIDDPNRTPEEGKRLDDIVNELVERANEKLLASSTDELMSEIDDFLANGGN